MTRRGTSNTNVRGSAESRRIRKRWLLKTFGDGTTCVCSTCPTVLTFDTITVDRYPLAGVDGGTYRRGNIRPQCQPCASKQGGDMSRERRAARGRVAIGVVLTAAAMLSTGCDDESAAGVGDGPGGVHVAVHWVDIGDGSRVQCVTEYWDTATDVATSCNWAGVQK